MGLADHSYDQFDLDEIDLFPELWADPELSGANVTIPYKESVIPYLDSLDETAESVGAVNVVKRFGNELRGYNSDFYGFQNSVRNWLSGNSTKALILGTGGASLAVRAVLSFMEIPYHMVSREPVDGKLTYTELNKHPELVEEHRLIINTTPLGMHPNVDSKPDLPYNRLGSEHYLFDLVYNPEVTAFLEAGIDAGASTKNGLEMLHLQAEKSWEIWNSEQ